MILTDTHAHLYSSKFDSDRNEMIRRSISAGVTRIFLPAIDSESHAALVQLAEEWPENCFPMMGLHPTSVDPATFEQEKTLAEDWFSRKKFIAVGETGIDLYWDKTHLRLQQESFAWQVELAKKLGLPVVIHSRNAFSECYEIVKERQDGSLKGVFHCFSDGIAEAEKVIALGNFYMGIGGVLTYKNSGLDAVVKKFGTDPFVLETDAPYLPPVPHRGKRNESAYTAIVAETMANILQRPVEEIAQATTENSKKLFGI
ncbi:MAG TPA: TatD family hydrolase [Bacteroidia bacterium]|nr:TatD family hydrolase [Bacteroidia bacterium]